MILGFTQFIVVILLSTSNLVESCGRLLRGPTRADDPGTAGEPFRDLFPPVEPAAPRELGYDAFRNSGPRAAESGARSATLFPTLRPLTLAPRSRADPITPATLRPLTLATRRPLTLATLRPLTLQPVRAGEQPGELGSPQRPPAEFDNAPKTWTFEPWQQNGQEPRVPMERLPPGQQPQGRPFQQPNNLPNGRPFQSNNLPNGQPFQNNPQSFQGNQGMNQVPGQNSQPWNYQGPNNQPWSSNSVQQPQAWNQPQQTYQNNQGYKQAPLQQQGYNHENYYQTLDSRQFSNTPPQWTFQPTQNPFEQNNNVQGQCPGGGRVLTPDERFDACCARSNMKPSCKQYCSYQTMDKDVMVGAYMRGECDIDSLATLLACINRHEDQRPCCESKGIYEICLDYCASTKTPPRGLDLKYLKCTEEAQFNAMVGCFREFDERNPVCGRK